MDKYGPNITISLDLLENLYISQFEGAKYKSDTPTFYSKSKFGKISLKTEIVLDLLENLHTSNILTHSFPMYPFSIPWKQGLEKGYIGNKWVKSLDLKYKFREIGAKIKVIKFTRKLTQ